MAVIKSIRLMALVHLLYFDEMQANDAILLIIM